ncbi:MAG: biosynthetic-type acetolactate synthase large subunit [Proteobacteria bacterium]|nr:biosynthetic-type acetolactate synthase large subunit [Pseudomonadota bacterium]
MKRRGAQILWEALTREGVDTVFGYPGGAILPAYDAMLDYDIHHVLVRHEQGAAHMADGYARASGKVGVAIATSGPGATNLVTGIATAMLDSSPIVCITGQVPEAMIGKDAFQEVDVTGITQPITKHNYLVTRAEDIDRTVREAFYIARSGRPGPVLIDITKNAQQAEIDYQPDEAPIRLPGYRTDLAAVAEEYEHAIELIDRAERPVILAGQGVIHSVAGAEVLEFVEKSEMPVAMTLLGLGGFPASHPLNLGMMGMHGESWVNQAIQEADLLLSFGMRFDDRVTGKLAAYAPRARKIHIDIDPAEISKNVAVDVGLVGDLKQVLRQLIAAMAGRKRPGWLDYIDGLKGHAAVRDIQRLPDTGHLWAAHVIHDLWRLTGRDTIVVTDVGQHQMWEAQYYKHDAPRTLITSGGLGTMGFALPAAIGARFARPEAEIWVIAGDGGFQMTAAELSTCAQEGIKLNIAIINNGYLGMVRQWQEFFYQRRYAATPILSPDYLKLAQAHGLDGMVVSSRAEVPRAVEMARSSAATMVVDFRVEQEDSVYPMVPAGAELHEMIRRPEESALPSPVRQSKDRPDTPVRAPTSAIAETGRDEL